MTKKVLIIDDEKEVVHIMKRRMQAVGYDVKVAYNGQEGLEVAHREHPHLILTDVMMPVMDGFAFYNELKQSEEIGHIPVIVATAYGTTEDVFRSLGATDFLLKPFDVQTVLAKLGGFFEGQKIYKVLIATKMFHLMKNILNEAPHLVDQLEIHVTNNQETLITDARVFAPRLIILDVALCQQPTAREVIEEWQKEKSLKDTTIFLTRNTLGDTRQTQPDRMIEECLCRGATRFIGPLNSMSFLTVVNEYCN